eukprot:scaffold963_cov103-Skeletonema_dohrnii-CCMP3373.AAC.2
MSSIPAVPQEAQHIISSDSSAPLIIKINAAEHTEDKDNIAVDHQKWTGKPRQVPIERDKMIAEYGTTNDGEMLLHDVCFLIRVHSLSNVSTSQLCQAYKFLRPTQPVLAWRSTTQSNSNSTRGWKQPWLATASSLRGADQNAQLQAATSLSDHT